MSNTVCSFHYFLVLFCLQGEPARVATVQGVSGEKGTPGKKRNYIVKI